MFSQEIQFIAPTEVVMDKESNPAPIKLFIPQWYKDITGKTETIKTCMPFLDSLSTGYGLRTSSQLFFHHNYKEWDKEGDYKTRMACPFQKGADLLNEKHINVNKDEEANHPRWQLEGSPLLDKNGNQHILKILYPFRIVTPKGYSCLFLPPMNNGNDYFSIIPGIVDTDDYDMEINFPLIVNHDKYQSFETTIPKGSLFAQCIPFKRESWKHKVVIEEKDNKKYNYAYKWMAWLKHGYKAISWNKKNFN